MNARIFNRIAHLILQNNKDQFVVDANADEYILNAETMNSMYGQIYTTIIVLDSFHATLMEDNHIEIQSIVYDAFEEHIFCIYNLLDYINESDECIGKEAETIGFYIEQTIMNNSTEFADRSLLDHLQYMAQFFFLIHLNYDDNSISISEKYIDICLDIYNDIRMFQDILDTINHTIAITPRQERLLHNLNELYHA